jgi:hypothetical protein
MPDSVSLLTLEFLAWIDSRPHTYAEAIEAWRSTCSPASRLGRCIGRSPYPDREYGNDGPFRGESYAARQGIYRK